jgi:hypothetical protein
MATISSECDPQSVRRSLRKIENKAKLLIATTNSLALVLAVLALLAPYASTSVGTYRFAILLVAFLLLLTGNIFRRIQTSASFLTGLDHEVISASARLPSRKQLTNWRDYWNKPNSIWVCSRHRNLHDRLVARDIAALIPSHDACVLDYGCGEASAAEEVASRCGRLILSDAADAVRKRLAERYFGHSKIAVIPPDMVQLLPPRSVDLIIVNSVIQYLSEPEFHQLLVMVRPLLKDTGVAVIGDVIPPEQSAIQDAISLLRFGFQGGFFIFAVSGLTRTYFSDYRQLRSTLGLSFYSESKMLSTLRNAGFLAERRRPNIGHNQGRVTFVARKYGSTYRSRLSHLPECPNSIRPEAPKQCQR